MQIPGCSSAYVDIVKLRGYVLNPNHEHGKNKAYVFTSVFGMTMEDADELQELLLSIACDDAAVRQRRMIMGSAMPLILSSSVVVAAQLFALRGLSRSDEDFPRLTSCYVL